MKKLAFLGGAAGAGMLALLGAHLSHAADHGDAPTAKASPMADLADVYAWNTADATKVNLAMTFSPEDDGTRTFGPSVAYAFHVTSRPEVLMAGMESKIICTFTTDTAGKCWLVGPNGKTKDYVEGDLSAATGKLSASGKFRVFAGRRSDPFFMNLGGIQSAIGYALGNICGGACPGTAHTDAAGCPDQVLKAQGDTIRTLIGSKPSANLPTTPCDDTANIDCFVGFNVMAIVVQVDKAELLQGTDTLLSVWASTHTGS
ncbi:MAG TPA: DUF4331 family protein [Kofleriaceae bacterium]|nr:DUF4331 family protein [Kofleriaceae bacterium]